MALTCPFQADSSLGTGLSPSPGAATLLLPPPLTCHLHARHHAVAGSITDVAPRVPGLCPAHSELPQRPTGHSAHPLPWLQLPAIPQPAHGGIGLGQLTGQHQVLPSHQAAVLCGARVPHDSHWWLWGWRDTP